MSVRILIGDCREKLRELPDASVNCCVTSPPYFGLRDYGCEGQMGLEPTPDEFVAGMVEVFREARRVLRDDGTLWLNIGDSRAGHGRMVTDVEPAKSGLRAYKNGPSLGRVPGFKRKQLIGIPWRLAFALQADGWWLRHDIIWRKTTCKQEQAQDRPSNEHEYLFLLAKSLHYYFDRGELGDDFDRSVWDVAPANFEGAHFATYPPALIEPCVLAGCPKGGTVLDPFGGAGTTGLVADRLQRDAILIELNPEYAELARKRIASEAGMFGEVLAA